MHINRAEKANTDVMLSHFSNCRIVYLAKNHCENYSPQMAPTTLLALRTWYS